MENHSTACQEGGKKPSSLTSLVRLSLVFCHPWSWHPIVEKVLETRILLQWTRSKRSSNKFRETLRWLIKRKLGSCLIWAKWLMSTCLLEQTIAFVGWWFKRVCWIFSAYSPIIVLPWNQPKMNQQWYSSHSLGMTVILCDLSSHPCF